MPGMKGVNPGDILQAVETQLVAGLGWPTADPIYWLMDGDEPVGNPTGRHDILLCATRKVVDNPKQVGGGRIGFRFELFIEVRLRTSNQQDRVGTSKDMLKDHWNQEEAIINALLRFFPTDTGDNTGNALTTEGLNLDTTITPNPDHASPKWGQSVGTWRCHYLPRLTTPATG